MSRLGAAVEGSHPLKRPRSCAYKALSLFPHLAGASFPSPPARVPSPATLSQSIPFPRVDQQPDFDDFHVLSTDCPQLYRRIHRQVLKASGSNPSSGTAGAGSILVINGVSHGIDAADNAARTCECLLRS